MSQRRRRLGRTIDKWAQKVTYDIISPPDLFGVSHKFIAHTVADDPQKVLSRTIEVPLYELTNDYRYGHIKVIFQVTDIRGTTAETRYKGHVYRNDYIRQLVTRRRTRIDTIETLQFESKHRIRVTVTAFTRKRCRSSQKHAIIKIISGYLKEKAKDMTLKQFAEAAVFGQLSQEIMERCKIVLPLAQVEIQKIKYLD